MPAFVVVQRIQHRVGLVHARQASMVQLNDRPQPVAFLYLRTSFLPKVEARIPAPILLCSPETLHVHDKGSANQILLP